MLRKAQSIAEIGLLAAIVAVVSIATFTIYNNQKVKLVNLSGVTVTKTQPAPPIITTLPDTTGRASCPGRTHDQFVQSVTNLTGDTLANNLDVVSAANQSGATISTDGSDQEILLSLVDRVNLIMQKDESTWTAKERLFISKFSALLDDADAVAATTTKDSHKAVATTSANETGKTTSTYTVRTATSTSTSSTTATNTCKQTGICTTTKGIQEQ